MTICKKCNAHVGDIGDPHVCPKPDYITYKHFDPNRVIREEEFIPIVKGQKCDICGSTAIDHTEAQCQLNRSLKLNRLYKSEAK